MTKKKLLFSDFLFLLLIFLLTSCHKEKQLITELKTHTVLPAYADIGNEQIAIIYADDSAMHTNIEVLNIRTQKIEKTAELDCFAELCRTFENGTVLLSDYSQYYLFYPDSCKFDVINVPVFSGYFNHDMSKYYYVSEEVLYCMNMEDHHSTPVQNRYNITIAALEGIHPEDDFLSVYAYTSAYTPDLTFGILNPKDGCFLALGNYIQQNPVYHGDCFYDVTFDSETENYSILYGSLHKNDSLKTIPLPELQKQNAPSIHFIDGSDYVIAQYLLNETTDSSVEKYRTELWHLGDTFQKFLLTDPIVDSGMMGNTVYLADTNLIISSFFVNGIHQTILIDPQLVNFSDFAKPQKAKTGSLVNKALLEEDFENCPENLKEFNTQIDSLQKRYQVRILLGEHAQKVLHTQGHETTVMENPADVGEALIELETALSRYPDNFFQQFQDSTGNGGMFFLLCGEFLNENVLGALTKGGHSETIGNRYYIAVYNCTSIAFCHEIWHATEDFILKRNPDAFHFETWNALNPKDYSYADYDITNDPEPNKWTLDTFGTEEIYFTDNYGRTDPKEGRANLMSYVMESVIPADELLPNKPLRNKLQVIANELRASFDTTEWDTPLWEKYFE